LFMLTKHHKNNTDSPRLQNNEVITDTFLILMFFNKTKDNYLSIKLV